VKRRAASAALLRRTTARDAGVTPDVAPLLD
jgi:hypothetical protein